MTKDKYFNHLESLNPELEQGKFIEILYHDAKKGNIFLAEKKADNSFRQLSITQEDVLNRFPSFSADSNYYVSVNTFDNCGKRSESHLYNIGALYIDVDCHNSTNLEADLNTVAEQLTAAYDTDAISVPTMITFTGRGFGIFYCLKQSINCKIENTLKMRLYLDSIYKSLANQYKAYLDSINSPGDIDMNVIESRRMIRLPGTINSKNGKKCHLIFLNTDTNGNIKFFEHFDEITKLKSSERTHKKLGQPTDNQNHNYNNTQLTYMLNLRIEALKKLIELRKDSAVPLRELTLFMIYTFCIQSGASKDIAFATIEELNNVYSSPLSNKELLAAVANPQSCKKYKYTTKKIIEVLAITPEELKVIGLQDCNKKFRQEQQKIQNQKKRTDRNERIVSFAIRHPDITYKKIAEEFNMCERSIKRVLASAGITRNKCISKGTKNTLILDVNNNCNHSNSALTPSIILPSHYLYALSFLNFLVEYCISGSFFYKVFFEFKKHFISYLNSCSVDNTDKIIILNAVCVIADHYTTAAIPECAAQEFNSLFTHFYNGKSYKKCKYVHFTSANLKSIPVKTIIDYQLTCTEFVHVPNYDILRPTTLSTNIKLTSSRTSVNQMSYKEQARHCNVAHLIDEVFPQYFNADNKAFPSDPFELWFNATSDSSIITKLTRVKYHVATFGEKRQIKFINFVNCELADKDLHATISLFENYFKTNDLLSLPIDKPKRSNAQKEASKLHREFIATWEYLQHTHNQTNQIYKQLYYNLKKTIENGKTEYTLSNKVTISPKTLKTKYMYRITSEDLEHLNLTYKDSITDYILVDEIKRIIIDKYPSIAENSF